MTWTANKGFQLSPFLERSHRAVLVRENSSPLERLIALGALLVADEELEASSLSHLRALTISDAPWKEPLARYLAEMESWSLDLGPDDVPAPERSRQLLNLRHDCELSFWAARHWGIAEPLGPEDLGELAAADDELRELLPRLISQNEWRQQMLSAISPPHRKQFFWYELGHYLPSRSLEHLEESEAVLQVFPELIPRGESTAALVSPSAHLPPGPADASELHLGNLEVPRSESPTKTASWWILAAAVAFLAPLSGWMFYQHSVATAEQEKAALQAQLSEAEREAEREAQRLKASLADAGTMSAAQMEALKAHIAAAEAKASAARSAARSVLPCTDRTKPCTDPGASRPKARAASGGSCPPGDPLCVD